MPSHCIQADTAVFTPAPRSLRGSAVETLLIFIVTLGGIMRAHRVRLAVFGH
jgi:hypothetical protein